MSEPFIGQISSFGFDFAPRGWAKCDGQLLPISSNTALFSLLGTTYGGDGKTTFALPDLRGRAPLHQGHSGGLSQRIIGQKLGAENVTLTTTQMPSHNHGATGLSGVMRCNDSQSDNTSPVGHTLARVGNNTVYDSEPPDSDMAANSVSISGSVAPNGGSQSHNNMQPSLVINFCIALVGIFPSRS